MDLPKIKRDLGAFVRDEKGTMTKKNILKAGVALGTLVGLSTSVSAHHIDSTPHSNSLSLNYVDPNAVGSHSHHSQHQDGC
ncbi:hypothetical protein HY639_04180 [Candidatus Woesearchaeota archaeon]|nr:hypothetical protein [Candidatus Woesearchaeota archaeon]